MRLSTVKRLLRLTLLPEEAIEYGYTEMKGISDRTVYSFECQKWVDTLSKAFNKYDKQVCDAEYKRRCKEAELLV